jgi:hypothetical protein
MSTWRVELERHGFVLLPGVFTGREMEAARRECADFLYRSAAAIRSAQSGSQPYGARNLLESWPGCVELLRKPDLLAKLLEVVGPSVGVVRGLYFDKPPGQSWALPWHRDRTIAVKEHGPLGTFQKPTVKAGVPHVEAPVALLDRMLTIRVHLDAMTDANGPLRVMPGSHRPGLPETAALSLHCEAGDALLMRPLLNHASAHCDPTHPGHRRIVHLELAPERELPEGYEWRQFVDLGSGNNREESPSAL